KYLISNKYLDRDNAYAGDSAALRIWRGGGDAHPELRAFMEKGESQRKLPRIFHHLWHDRVNMEFAEACMQAMFWHENINPKFNAYIDSDEYRENSDRAIRAYFKGNPIMLGLYKLFPDMFHEQVKRLSYYSNLGLFWEVMAPVFFEMSDLYDEGKLTTVPEAMDFLVNGIFAIAGRPIYHHLY
ncbi:MAG: CO2 hydration protein, partial [Cyanobacteria bacterium J06629_9]